jgi:glycosyltransferase involved in cell wall biosynthesis
MRGLYASIQTPSPLAGNGGGQACFQYLETLTQLHEVDVMTVVSPGEEKWLEPLEKLADRVMAIPRSKSTFEKLARWAWSVCKSARLHPIVNRPFIEAIHQQLRQERYDFVQVDWTEIARWVHVPKGTLYLSCAIDVRERIAEEKCRLAKTDAERLRTLKEWKKIEKEERDLFRRLDRVLTLTGADTERARNLAPDARIHRVIYDRVKENVTPPAWDSREPKTLLYVGAYGIECNREAADILVERILPLVREKHPEARVVLAGSNPPEKFRRWADNGLARVTGFVEDIGALYAKAAMMTTPMAYGGGHVKMIEAMSWGVPVATTPVGRDGIGSDPGDAVLIGETPEDLAAHVIRLFDNPKEAERIGLAGRAHLEKELSAARAVELLKEAFGD